MVTSKGIELFGLSNLEGSTWGYLIIWDHVRFWPLTYLGLNGDEVVSNVEGVEVFGMRPSRMIGHFVPYWGDGKAVEDVASSANSTVEVKTDFIFAYSA
jgi:hypothetical protein